MKTLLLLLTLALSVPVFGQKTKNVQIWKGGMGSEILTAMYAYDENNELLGIRIHFSAQDHAYQHITKIFTLFLGTPGEFLPFIDQLIKFLDEEGPNTSSTIMGRRVSTTDVVWGHMGLFVYGTGKDDNAYRSFSPKGLRGIRKIVADWCKKNNVNLDGTLTVP
jgi:hypothetical protein